MCASALTRLWPAERAAVNPGAIRRVITAGAIVGVVGAVSFAAVHALLILPICVLAGTAAALARRIVDEDIS
jgi:hypothetical protein